MCNPAFVAWLSGWTGRARSYKPGMPAISALLLDLDGTLLDTEPLHFEAHRRFLAGKGIVPTAAELVGNIGKGDDTFYAEYMQRHGLAGDPVAWVAEKTRVLMDLYREGGVPVQPGARELLAHAAGEGIACMVVTSSERGLADLALAVSGLAAALPQRVCREDTVRHKPHPEPYLLAVQRLGRSPSACLVFEDSVSGVAAARSAGCPVVALRGHLAEADVRRAGAQRVLDRLDEVLPIRAFAMAAG